MNSNYVEKDFKKITRNSSRERIVSFIGLDLSGGRVAKQLVWKKRVLKEENSAREFVCLYRARGDREDYRKVLCIDKGPRLFRDRKPICNVLRAGFEILNSGRGRLSVFGSCSSFSRFFSQRQQRYPFFLSLQLVFSLNSYVVSPIRN